MFYQLGQLLYRHGALAEAIKAAIGATQGRKDELEQEWRASRERLRQLDREQEKLLQVMIGLDASSPMRERIQKKVEETDQAILTGRARNDQLKAAMECAEIEIPKDFHAKVAAYVQKLVGRAGRNIMTSPVEDQQKLARFFFGRGNRKLGVFVSQEDHPEFGHVFRYEMRGLLGVAAGALGGNVYLADGYEELEPRGPIDVEALAELLDS